MSIDNRQAQRYTVAVAGEVYTPQSVLQANTRNLSESGVCLDISQPLTEDAIVGVSIFLVSDGIEDPDSEPLNVKAKVIWCTEREDEGFSAGMRFETVTDQAKAALAAFLKQLQ